MRYKFLYLCSILLIATPVFAQKSVPILSQTLRTTNPTTVITGQTLKQTYIIRFIDLTHQNEEIIIDKSALEKKIMDDFEVVGFKIDYKTKQGQFLEHQWYVNYTLRIINPKKGPKVIKSFVIPWKLKKEGQQENDPGLQYNFDVATDEVHLNYASTIPAKDPVPALRDLMDFKTSSRSGLLLKSASWLLAVVPLGLWLILFVVGFKSSAKISREEEKNTVQSDESETRDLSKISKRKALSDFRQGIRKLGSAIDPHTARQNINDILIAMKNYIRTKTGLSDGAMPSEMVTAISGNKNLGSFQKPLLALAEKAKDYEDHIESGSVMVLDTVSEVNELRKLLGNLRWYNRLFRRR